jgi:1,2-dihydroxy-3-keto-5-methylthiopentene dioxygenase
MAFVTLQATKKTISDPEEITTFLAYHGITHTRWDVPQELAAMANKDLLDAGEKNQVLANYKPQLDDLKAKGGYIQNDMVCLCPATPNIETLLSKFDKDHYHTEDEVRFILSGRGIFGFEGKGREKFTIEVVGGDFITIPAYNWHWFNLGESRDIKAIRLFQDMSGWTPTYRQHPDEPSPAELKRAS